MTGVKSLFGMVVMSKYRTLVSHWLLERDEHLSACECSCEHELFVSSNDPKKYLKTTQVVFSVGLFVIFSTDDVEW